MIWNFAGLESGGVEPPLGLAVAGWVLGSVVWVLGWPGCSAVAGSGMGRLAVGWMAPVEEKGRVLGLVMRAAGWPGCSAVAGSGMGRVLAALAGTAVGWAVVLMGWAAGWSNGSAVAGSGMGWLAVGSVTPVKAMGRALGLAPGVAA